MLFYTNMLTNRPNLLLAIIFILILPGIFWGLPSAFTPQDDAPTPLGSLLFVAEYSKSHLNTTYPAFHELLLLPLYAIVFGVDWVFGGIGHLSSTWPYGISNVTLLFSALTVVTNLVSAVMGVILLWSIFPFVEKSRKWFWFALLFIGFNGLFVYYARVGNLDMPYNFWWAVAWFFLWRYLMQDKPVYTSLLPAGVAAACAAGSKDQAAGLIVGAGLLLLLLAPRKDSSTFLSRLRQTTLFALTIIVAYAVVAILPQPARWWNHARFVVSPHAPTAIRMTVEGEFQILWITLQTLASVFTIPILGLSAIGTYVLFVSRRSLQFWILALPAIGYYIVIIAITRECPPRFVLPFTIPVLVLTTHGVAFIGDRLQGPAVRRVFVSLLAVYLAYTFATSYVPVTYAQTFDMKRQMGRDLPGLLPPKSPILLSEMQTYEFPSGTVYEQYQLMRLPNEPVVPASRHAASIFRPLENNVAYYLLGTGTAGLPSNTPMPQMPLRGELIREWKYPQWIKDNVLVPCIFEFALYRRTGPLPLDYVPPPFVVMGNR